jgi:hypothetical protein
MEEKEKREVTRGRGGEGKIWSFYFGGEGKMDVEIYGLFLAIL